MENLEICTHSNDTINWDISPRVEVEEKEVTLVWYGVCTECGDHVYQVYKTDGILHKEFME